MNVLGTPTETEVEAMCDQVEVNLPLIKGTGLLGKFSFLEDSQDLRNLVDLLEKIICYDPKKRLKPF